MVLQVSALSQHQTSLITIHINIELLEGPSMTSSSNGPSTCPDLTTSVLRLTDESDTELDEGDEADN